MNFGTILNSVTKKCVTLMVESEERKSKALARDFIKYVHLKEVLEKQFRVYHQLNGSFIKDRDMASDFVSECLSMLDGFKFEDILAYNHLVETKFDVPKMDTTELNKAIATAIRWRTSRDKRDPAGYVESIKVIVDHVCKVKGEKDPLQELDHHLANSELKFLQPKHVLRIALKKFNDRYASKFDVEDRAIFNTLREGDEKKIAKLYSDVCGSLISEFDAFDVGQDRDLAEKLNQALDKTIGGYTQENLLNAHELRSELKRLREES